MKIQHPQTLLEQWEGETMPEKEMIRQILRNLVKTQSALEVLTISFYNMRSDVDSLIAHTGMPPNPKGKKALSKEEEARR